jgi:RNA polymerase sigma factor FliA
MMTPSKLRGPFDPPEVLRRVRDGLPIVDMICHQIRNQIGATARMEDLQSHGREGLLSAARTFDPRRGVPFRRWANIRVRGAVLDGVRSHSHLPRSLYARLRTGHTGELGAEERTSSEAPDPQASAELADRRIGEFLACAATAVAMGLLGASVSEPGEPIDNSASAEQRMIDGELWAAVRRAMAELPDLERRLLERHYIDGVTFEQAAAELGLSKSWASRLHTRAVAFLTRSMKRSASDPWRS